MSRKRRRKNSSLKKGANKGPAAASKVHPNDLPRDTKYTNKQVHAAANC